MITIASYWFAPQLEQADALPQRYVHFAVSELHQAESDVFM